MPTLCPGPTFHSRSGEYVVMPAHSNGATAARSASGCVMRSTNDSRTTIWLE